MRLAIANCRLEKIKKLNIVAAVTCAIVVENLRFLVFKNENVKTLRRVLKDDFS